MNLVTGELTTLAVVPTASAVQFEIVRRPIHIDQSTPEPMASDRRCAVASEFP